MNAILIDAKDNVAVVLNTVSPKQEIHCVKDTAEYTMTALDAIPRYHKIAIRDIKKGEPIVKYGEHIGIAAMDIQQGSHVHVHNVRNNREVL